MTDSAFMERFARLREGAATSEDQIALADRLIEELPHLWEAGLSAEDIAIGNAMRDTIYNIPPDETPMIKRITK